MEKKEAFKFTGADAEYYDKYLGPVLFEPYAHYLASRIDPAKLSSVLEIACGTGRVTRHLRSTLPASVKLVATDISNDMMNVALREVDNRGIEFRTEDAQNLSFPDNSFDLVICQFGMMFLPDKNKGFSEAFRVLKPGGKLMYFTWDDTIKMPLFKLLINDLIAPCFAEEDISRFFIPFSLNNTLQLQAFMTDAGFKNVTSNNVVLKSGAADVKSIVIGLFRKHMLGKEVMAKDPSAFERIAQQFEEGILKQFGAASPVFDLSAFLTIGEK